MTRNRSLVRIALAALVVVAGCVIGIIVGGELYAPAPEQREPEREVEPPTLTIVDSQHEPRTNVNKQRWIA